MTTQSRRSFGGNPQKTKTHSRSSSSTISLTIETPSDTSPSPSPVDMAPAVNGANGVNRISEDMAKAEINGTKNTKQRVPVDRKKSSPLMPPFMVSAPGKVIAFGEHAVVHGKVRLC